MEGLISLNDRLLRALSSSPGPPLPLSPPSLSPSSQASNPPASTAAPQSQQPQGGDSVVSIVASLRLGATLHTLHYLLALVKSVTPDHALLVQSGALRGLGRAMEKVRWSELFRGAITRKRR